MSYIILEKQTTRRASETNRQQDRMRPVGLRERPRRELYANENRVPDRELRQVLHIQLSAQNDEHNNKTI